MRFLPTRFHGLLDYLVGSVLIGMPVVFDVRDNGRLGLMALGVFVVLYSLFTDYELGVVRFLRVRFHLLLDALVGAALLALPWLVGEVSPVRWPILAIGFLSLLLAATTKVRALGTAGTHQQNGRFS